MKGIELTVGHVFHVDANEKDIKKKTTTVIHCFNCCLKMSAPGLIPTLQMRLFHLFAYTVSEEISIKYIPIYLYNTLTV